MNLVLASASPRRRDILRQNGYDFKIVPSLYDENISNKPFTKDLVENCAYNKAKSILKGIDDNSIIISADTVVICDNIILGKPNDKDNAIKMLENLSDKTHFVATAICLINTKTGKILKDTDITYVTFKKLSNTDILTYLEKHKPYDKAGSYGIQDEDFDFCVNIKGEIDNVIGFPIKLFKKLYSQL